MNLNLEGLIPIGAGAWVTLMGFGVLPVKNDQFKLKFQSHMKWLGPACLAFGILMLFRVL